MKKLALELIVVVLIVASVVDCQRWNANGRNLKKPSRAGSYYSEETTGGRSVEVNGNGLIKSQPVKQSRGGIGAWGYVSIILFVILSGLGIYYTILFYPIVCKKQRMYHVMGSTTV